MKRIGIDCRLASSPTGLGRYVRELVPALLSESNAIEWVLFGGEWTENCTQNVQVVRTSIPHYSLQEQFVWPFILRNARLDLLFVPHFNVPLYCPVPFVMTIHDLILHAYPNQTSLLKRMMYHVILKSALKRSIATIAVSRFTASEVAKYYNKICTVFPQGTHLHFTRATDEVVATIRKKYGLSQRYFLYVGNAKEHKNVPVLVEAFLQANMRDTELLLVSPGVEADDLLYSSNVRRFVNVNDADLVGLYSGAEAFVTASLYEGFCLPIVEALACGCPVIASNTTAIPELAVRGVQLVEPTLEAFSKALHNWSKPDVVEKLARDWNQVAQETLKVLEK
jgi:glycosyltransferase involved in cell wall biosynthesis